MTHIRKYFGEIAAAVILCLDSGDNRCPDFLSRIAGLIPTKDCPMDGPLSVQTKRPSGEGEPLQKKVGK